MEQFEGLEISERKLLTRGLTNIQCLSQGTVIVTHLSESGRGGLPKTFKSAPIYYVL